MYIKEVVIEGFKSYAHRTVIDGFDCNFNAITGLNGSGKSNILDAICFVLGLSTLSLVRVTNLQELIYKNGQAGVTKASVTILFDNTEKSRSPEAFRRFDNITIRREISLAGTSKYSINGSKSTAEKVKEFFMHVGLNVNNANFLIMQGRITQVINMKPREIQSLIEETAGTNVYESTKRKALATMAKKQRKLDEIDQILMNELEPKLAKLREDQQQYYEFKELEETLRIHEWRFHTLCYLRNEKEVAKKHDEKDRDRAKLIEWQGRASRKENKIAELEQELLEQNKSAYNEEDRRLEDELKALTSQCSLLKSNMKTFEVQLEEYKAEIALLARETNAGKTHISNAETELRQAEETSESLTSRLQEKNNELGALKAKLSALQQGLQVEADNSLQLSIEKTKQELAKCSQRILQIQQQIGMQEKELASSTNKLRFAERELQTGKDEEDSVLKDIEALQRRLQSLPESEINIRELKNSIAKLDAQRGGLAQELAKHDVRRYGLDYRDPEPNFDRSKVFGRVARLMKLKDLKYANAIEAMVGGNLFSVVVEDDNVGSKLLKGKVLGNVKLLPLNKLRPRGIDRRKVEDIQQRFHGQAHLAIDLIEYDSQLDTAMKFVFGFFFVCEDREIARRIAYDRQYGFQSVTVEGDVYDPQGCLSGGGQASTQSHFRAIATVESLELSIAEVKRNLTEATKQLAQIELAQQQRKSFEQELLQRTTKLAQIRSNYGDVSKEALEQQVEKVKGNIAALKENLSQQQENLQDLTRELQDQSSQENQASKRGVDVSKQLEVRYAKVQEEHSIVENKLKSAQVKASKISAKLASTVRDVETKTEAILKKEATLKLKHTDIDKLRLELEAKLELIERTKGELSIKQQRNAEASAALETLNRRLAKRKEQMKSSLREINEIGQKVKKLESEIKDIEHENVIMDSNYSWLAAQLQNRGARDYDPLIYNFEQGAERLQRLMDEVKSKQRRVNMKVSATLEQSIIRFEKLQENRGSIVEDKAKIDNVISELDEKKNEDITKTGMEISKNFAEIFNTLLPGANAKLEPVETGLEMNVGFNGIWKKNLSELSGGQRSLLALSFILASLKYKPAPLYILDEIDAALDLSHTQNIGSMLRMHFSQSQFIVVSLKEGMFTNANVLYRTQFIEGRSTIERRALRENSADQERQRKSRAYR